MPQTLLPLALSGAGYPPPSVGAGSVLAHARTLAASFAHVLGIRMPTVVGLRSLDPVTLDPDTARTLRGADFLAGYLPLGQRGILVVNETAAGWLPATALRALVAHEIGHAADWLLHLRLETVGLIPGRLGRRLLRGFSSLSPEVFADRVAASLVGTAAVLDLYLATFAIQGGMQRSQARLLAALHGLPDHPDTPPSLRLARLFRGRRKTP